MSASDAPRRPTIRTALRGFLRGWRAARRLAAARPGAPRPTRDLIRHSRAAIDWIAANSVSGAGLRVHAGATDAYAEVTGYTIPTLLNWGEHRRATEFARWLMAVQNPDGSWSDPSGKAPYTFDTGQVLKGLGAIAPRLPAATDAIRRGCDWLLTQIEPTGRITTPDKSAWRLPNGTMIGERIHLYALEPLRDAGKRFDDPRYEDAVDRALRYYLRDAGLTRFDMLSHFHAYVLEALVDLGHRDRAAEGMAAVGRLQRADGAVPAYPDVDWVCSVGVAQYAVVWYKLGERRSADRGLDHLCRLQHRSGGFYGSDGAGADYFPDREISWAAKYFLDACAWHVRAAFDAEVDAFPETIAEDDGRVAAVVRSIGDVSGRRLLDAGCGKGRFSRLLAAKYPSAEVWGVDLSESMLSHVPPAIKARQGTLLNLPFDDGTFDVVFSVEALEHSVHPEAAIGELCRVLTPGGRIVIVDKNIERRGALPIEAWERWFDGAEVRRWLRRYCVDVSSELVAHGPATAPDGLFIAWRGRKASSAVPGC